MAVGLLFVAMAILSRLQAVAVPVIVVCAVVWPVVLFLEVRDLLAATSRPAHVHARRPERRHARTHLRHRWV